MDRICATLALEVSRYHGILLNICSQQKFGIRHQASGI
jgi:hypothetical protein